MGFVFPSGSYVTVGKNSAVYLNELYIKRKCPSEAKHRGSYLHLPYQQMELSICILVILVALAQGNPHGVVDPAKPAPSSSGQEPIKPRLTTPEESSGISFPTATAIKSRNPLDEIRVTFGTASPDPSLTPDPSLSKLTRCKEKIVLSKRRHCVVRRRWVPITLATDRSCSAVVPIDVCEGECPSGTIVSRSLTSVPDRRSCEATRTEIVRVPVLCKGKRTFVRVESVVRCSCRKFVI